jgi:ankyrin repeat protein
MSAISQAAFDGDLDKVKRLAAEGKSVNGESYDVFTPLMWAASRGHELVALTLMELGANPNLRSSIGHSALMEAARGCHLDVVKLLVKHGADVNAADIRRKGGYTPLMYAAAQGCPGMCEYLLSHGANIAATDWSGNTAAQIAASHGDLPLSRWLSSQETGPEKKADRAH